MIYKMCRALGGAAKATEAAIEAHLEAPAQVFT